MLFVIVLVCSATTSSRGITRYKFVRMGIDFLLLPCMVISAWLSFVLFVLGRAINSPDHLIAVPQELKRSKEIASYVTASLHMLTAFACAFLKYRKARVELRVVNNARPTIAD